MIPSFVDMAAAKQFFGLNLDIPAWMPAGHSIYWARLCLVLYRNTVYECLHGNSEGRFSPEVSTACTHISERAVHKVYSAGDVIVDEGIVYRYSGSSSEGWVRTQEQWAKLWKPVGRIEHEELFHHPIR